MGLIINTSDFASGENAIATDVYTTAQLNLAIDTNEKRLLYEMLGIELFDLFELDLSSGVPTNPIYLEIFNPFVKEINDIQYHSIGIKQMLVKWVYFFYVRTQPQTNTIQGNTQNEGTISNPSAMSYSTLINQYNQCIETYKAIQAYIEKNKEVSYPTYKGIYKKYNSWA